MAKIFCIPGLAMAASELPWFEGVVRLENPEIGAGERLGRAYTLEEVAEGHLRTILAQAKPSDELTLIGMSMGGMIASILASEFRSWLPRATRFSFLVTSPNLPELPAIRTELFREWVAVRPGSTEDFRKILTPFFSDGFLKAAPDQVDAYATYRATGGNKQSASAYFRQSAALSVFEGGLYFPKVDPKEALFIGGGNDRILGPAHNAILRELNPEAAHQEIVDLGHMINYEMPEIFRSGGWR